MENNFNPAMLRLAREQAGKSQVALRDEFHVSQARWSKIETGAIQPDSALLNQISSRFCYPKSFFYQNAMPFVSGMIFHRKRSSLGAVIRSQIEAEVRLRFFDVIKLYQHDGRKSDMLLREGRTPEKMAQAIRKYWGLGTSPIDNLVDVLEAHNIIVLMFDFNSDKLDGFVVPADNEIACIAINANKAFSPDRQRMSLSHELGHLLLHCNDFPDEKTEDEANRFAAEFLAPASVIENELMPPLSLARLRDLKIRWKVSMASLVFRAHSLKTIDDKKYKNAMIYLSANGFRKSEPFCGIGYERPSLLTELMKQFVSQMQNPLEVLNLSWERFHERYPEISLEGQSEMTPTIS